MTKPRPKPTKAATANKSREPAKAKTDWRHAVLDQVRQIVQQADPEAVEEVKWRKPTKPEGVPVWSHDGILFTGETYKSCVKLTFAKGASLPDPSGLFNASLEGNTRRAIDIYEGDTIDEQALTALILAAVALNSAEQVGAKKAKKRSAKR